jgi:protoporphyrinogen oxidase
VEKESRVGGLVRTEVMHGGFRFDPTGHWLHLRDPGMKALVHERLLPDGLVTVARRAAVFTRGVFTRFPYQVNTHGLPAEVAENLLGFVEATVGEAAGRCGSASRPTSRSSSSVTSGQASRRTSWCPTTPSSSACRLAS